MGKKTPIHKLVVLGAGGVGKTAFTIQFVSTLFITEYDPTIEDSYFKEITLDGVSHLLDILDTAGQKEYSGLRGHYMRGGEGFILMYSITLRETFSRAKEIYLQIQRVQNQARANCSSQQNIPASSESLIVGLGGNKADLSAERDISVQEGFSLAKELNCPFHECSSHNFDQVAAPMLNIVRNLERQKQNREATLESINHAKESAAAMRAEKRPIVRRSRFFSLPFRGWKEEEPLDSTMELPQQKLLTRAMGQAVRYNKISTVKRLLALGADPNETAGADRSPLSTAAALGYKKMAALLISQNAAVYALFRGSTALVVAAAEGHLDIVKLLLEEGALIDAPSSIYGTALMAATFRGHVKLAKFLLENGANVNAIGSQYSTALHTAVVVGKREIAKILLDAGADINALDKNYCSPLHLAASLGHAEIVRLLLLRGSSNIITHIHPTYGSPLEAAYANSHFHAAKILVEFGANDSTYSFSDIQKVPPTSRATRREISGREDKKIIDESPDMAVLSSTTSSTDSKDIPNQSRSMEKQCKTRSSRPSHRDDFKIAIICALSIEADAVEALLDRCWDKDGEPYGKATGDTNAYTTGMLGRHNVILVYMPGIGKGSASSVATNIRNSYKSVELALVVGVCGAVPEPSDDKEIILGDVVLSNGIVQYDFGRLLPTSYIRKDTLLDNLGRPNPEIRSLLTKLGGKVGRMRLEEKLSMHLTSLQDKHPNHHSPYPGISQDTLFPASYQHRHHQGNCDTCSVKHGEKGPICQTALQSTCEELQCNMQLVITRQRHNNSANENIKMIPRVHFGLIASGDSVIKSGLDRDEIAAQEGVIAFEMEGAGVWDNLPCVIIKGVCDYADSHKNKLWQGYAAASAAACMKAFLDEWISSPLKQNPP